MLWSEGLWHRSQNTLHCSVIFGGMVVGNGAMGTQLSHESRTLKSGTRCIYLEDRRQSIPAIWSLQEVWSSAA